MLSGLFTSYLHDHPHERTLLERLADLIREYPAGADLIARTNFTGHITASGFVLTPDLQHILLVWHQGLHLHVQPGGHLDLADPTPRAGARREVTEETGLDALAGLTHGANPDVPFDIDTHFIPANPRKNEPEHWHHDFRYLFIARPDAVLRLAADEVDDAKWVPVNDLARYPTLERVGAKLAAFCNARARETSHTVDTVRTDA